VEPERQALSSLKTQRHSECLPEEGKVWAVLPVKEFDRGAQHSAKDHSRITERNSMHLQRWMYKESRQVLEQ